jgi:hypothetical protein
MALTTVLNCCGHETSDWPLLYKTDLEFGHTYNTLLEGKKVPNFHLQDALLCHPGHLCVPSSERVKMFWEAHYSWFAGHIKVEKTVVVGQTKVVNQMIVHIMCMYNSENPHTSDESLSCVQHSYNRALHRSTNHIPFQVGLGFQPLCPIDVAMPFAATRVDSTHVQSEAYKANKFILRIQHIRRQAHHILDRANSKYK